MLADLALIGFGHVGRRFARLLDERRRSLEQDHGLEPRIVGIATRRHGSAWNAGGLDVEAALANVGAGAPLEGTAGAAAIIERLGQSRAPLRVVVETTTLDIRAGQPAIDHVRQALGAGCHVVTANKGPAAFAFASLDREAKERDLSFLFEGAVMDGVPIFNLVRETMPGVEIRGFRGVVNATTNHILTALEEGEPFEEALARMQAAGIAEADPSLDIDGWDAAAKASALANALMGARMTPLDVSRMGVGPEAADAARAARAAGRRLKLVAEAGRRADGAVHAAVRLVDLPEADLLAGLRGQANALILQTDLLGEVAVVQLDGDLTQTAYALLSDLITVRRRSEARPGAGSRRIP